jgi:hypothetical protein
MQVTPECVAVAEVHDVEQGLGRHVLEDLDVLEDLFGRLVLVTFDLLQGRRLDAVIRGLAIGR